MTNLLIFFDNQTFKLNNIIINYIKRWIVYKILNDYTKYDNIYIYKTYPNFVEFKVNTNNLEEDINNILNFINNIIYKKYDEYMNIHLKMIFDKLNEQITNNIDEILIISSLKYNIDIFSEYNIKYINDIIESKNLNINFINISNFEIINNMFPKLNEQLINIYSLKTENIYINEIINLDINLNISEMINININKVELTKEINIIEYLKLFSFIESIILYNTKNNFKNKDLYQKIKLFLNIEINVINENNIIIKNIIKSYKNSISNLINRFCDFPIKLPINKLIDELSDTYIKYILEFYEIIYPKIYNLNNQTISKIYKKKLNNIHYETSEIKIKNIKNIKNIKIDDISLEYLQSSLTMTNWKEEFDNLNPFGFLIKYIPNKFSYSGILDFNSSILKTYPNMIINNITTNLVSLYDYYQIILFDYENTENTENNEIKEIFNIKDFNIIDNINGDGNILLPLYINKDHWDLTKNLWSYHISFINNCFEFEYNKKMDNIYFLSIFKLLNNLKNLNQNNNIKSIIRLFGYILRTCIQILIDNKFLHSIKNDYIKYLDLVLNLNIFDKNSIFYDYIIRTIQLIISNGISDLELQTDLNKITIHLFKNMIIQKYKIDFWEMINDSNTTEEKRKLELDLLKNDILQENLCWIHLDYDLKIFNKIIRAIYTLNGFNQFIKQIDKTNGCLEDVNNNEFLNINIIKNIIIDKCSEQLNLDNYNVDISKYLI
jgi:hypothetical protein